MDLAKFVIEWDDLCKKIGKAAKAEEPLNLSVEETKLLAKVLIYLSVKKVRGK